MAESRHGAISTGDARMLAPRHGWAGRGRTFFQEIANREERASLRSANCEYLRMHKPTEGKDPGSCSAWSPSRRSGSMTHNMLQLRCVKTDAGRLRAFPGLERRG